MNSQGLAHLVAKYASHVCSVTYMPPAPAQEGLRPVPSVCPVHPLCLSPGTLSARIATSLRSWFMSLTLRVAVADDTPAGKRAGGSFPAVAALTLSS